LFIFYFDLYNLKYKLILQIIYYKIQNKECILYYRIQNVFFNELKREHSVRVREALIGKGFFWNP